MSGQIIDPNTLDYELTESRGKQSLPLEVAQLLANALNQALRGETPMLQQEQAMRCLREAGANGVAARIEWESPPGRYVLYVDKIKVVVAQRPEYRPVADYERELKVPHDHRNKQMRRRP